MKSWRNNAALMFPDALGFRSRSAPPALLLGCAAWCLVLVVGELAALAQKPPGLGYVFPPTVAAGGATEVHIGGFDFTRDLEWFVHDDRVQLEILGEAGDYLILPPPYWSGPRASTPALPIPREVPARFTVPSEVGEGLVRFQVANANGSSTTAAFYVSREPGIVESRSRDLPQLLPELPIAVSGRLGKLTEVDRYELIADRDGVVSAELLARRLGSDFHGVLQVRGPAGDLLADFADTQGFDGGLTWAVAKGQRYQLSLHDVDFRGDWAYVYRLAVRYGPRVVATLPATGTPGSKLDVEFVGYGLQSGASRLESVTREVTFPADEGLESHSFLLETPYGSTSVTIPLSRVAEARISLESATAGEPVPIAISPPFAAAGRLPLGNAGQRWSWQAEPDQHWSVQVQSRAIGGSLDVAVAVFDPEGKLVGEHDDLPGTSDAELQFKSTTSGTYTCLVRRMSAPTGRLDEVLRVQIQRAEPDYALTVPQQVAVPLSGKAELAVQVQRLGGFDGEISLTPSGLPAGVTPDGAWVVPAGKSDIKVSLAAAGDAAVVARSIKVQGTAKLGETELLRTATAVGGGNLAPRTPADARLEQVLLAMTMPAPLDVLVVDRERQRDVHRGTTYLAELELVRKDGFAGDVEIHMSAQQARYRQGIRGPIVLVPAAANRAFYPCFMPEWLATDLTRRMVVHGVVGVADPQGNVRYLTKAGDARITMILEGALLKISSAERQFAVPCGGTLEIPFTIARSTKLPLSATIELIVPDELAGLVQAEPVVLAPGTDQGVLRLKTADDARLTGLWQFTLTATALQDGRWPVVSQTDVAVEFSPRE